MARAPDIPYGLRLPSSRTPSHRALAALALLLLLARVAHADPAPSLEDDAGMDVPAAGFPDPLEPINRLTLGLNLHVDRWVIDPITRAYTFAVPGAARRSIRHA